MVNGDENIKDIETEIEKKRVLIESAETRDVIGLICIRSNLKIENAVNKVLSSFKKLLSHNGKEFKKINETLIVITEDIKIIKQDLGLNGNHRR